jgi:hypothetical protein
VLTQAEDLILTRDAATGLLLSTGLPGTVPVTDTWTPSLFGEFDA